MKHKDVKWMTAPDGHYRVINGKMEDVPLGSIPDKYLVVPLSDRIEHSKK
jgi:hypothetical protein